jgi:hypothetical protein
VCKESILNSLYFGLSKNDLEVSTSRFFVPNFLKLRSVILDFFLKKIGYMELELHLKFSSLICTDGLLFYSLFCYHHLSSWTGSQLSI